MAKTISQATFDAAVEENITAFEVDYDQAVQDAIEQFDAQGIDLSSLTIPGRPSSSSTEPHLKDNRGYFFQSDADLARQDEIKARVNYDKGSALELPSKALALQVCTTIQSHDQHAFIIHMSRSQYMARPT